MTSPEWIEAVNRVLFKHQWDENYTVQDAAEELAEAMNKDDNVA